MHYETTAAGFLIAKGFETAFLLVNGEFLRRRRTHLPATRTAASGADLQPTSLDALPLGREASRGVPR